MKRVGGQGSRQKGQHMHGLFQNLEDFWNMGGVEAGPGERGLGEAGWGQTTQGLEAKVMLLPSE